MKLKRELNAKLGFEKVREKLEARSVDMRDITPPTEEELHLLVNGLSLSDDENVRGMWAGLFAKSLEPDSGVTAENASRSIEHKAQATISAISPEGGLKILCGKA